MYIMLNRIYFTLYFYITNVDRPILSIRDSLLKIHKFKNKDYANKNDS